MLVLGVIVGGFLGGLIRYGFSLIMRSPAGTFAANIVGAALLGCATALYRVMDLGDFYAALILTGLAGGLSTWSTLAKELGLMVRRKQYKKALLYGFFTLSIGLIALWRGLEWTTRAYYSW